MITLEQIAREVGVSRQTVSNALNGTNKEAWSGTAKRNARIREVAARLGYQPNGAAKAIQSGRFGCIGLLLSKLAMHSYLGRQTCDGIYDDADEHNLHIALFRVADEVLTDVRRMPKILREWMVDGILIDYNCGVPPQLATLVEEHKLPAIWLNAKREADCVRPDDLSMAQDVTERLLALGHRRIAYLDFQNDYARPDNHYSISDRPEGYRRSMTAHGLTPYFILRGETDPEDLVPKLVSLLAGKDRPTAIVCYTGNDTECVMVAAARLGLEIPRDISIVSFDLPAIRRAGRIFSKYALPEYEMGRRACELLRQKIDDPTICFPPELLPAPWEEGDTCGPALPE